MTENLKEYKEMLEEDINLLGYQDLRYSLFAGSDNRQEYQLRIEKESDKFTVYMTAERASIVGKYEYDSPFDAFDMFLNIMQSIVLSNRRAVKNNEEPEYTSSLWSK